MFNHKKRNLFSTQRKFRNEISLAIFYYFFQSHWVNIKQTWHKAFLSKDDTSLFQMKDLALTLRGDNNEIVKTH